MQRRLWRAQNRLFQGLTAELVRHGLIRLSNLSLSFATRSDDDDDDDDVQ